MRSTRFGTNDRSAIVSVILRHLRSCAQDAMMESVAAGKTRAAAADAGFNQQLRAVVARDIKL